MSATATRGSRAVLLLVLCVAVAAATSEEVATGQTPEQMLEDMKDAIEVPDSIELDGNPGAFADSVDETEAEAEGVDEVASKMSMKHDHAVQLKLRNCRQSSDYNGNSRCSKAIDGNTNQKWSHKSLSCTKKEANAFWETQLERPTQFSRVRIFNRQDCCAKRLTNFVIKVDGEECARYDRSTSFSVKTFRCSKVGRVLRIEGRTRNYLTLAEVQVFGTPPEELPASSMLKLSNCQQSSVYAGRYKCNLALDGNTNPKWSGKSQACTNNEANPWWEARTEAPTMIRKVRIFNRQDCCPERLQHFVIKVDGEICARYDSKAPLYVWTFDCNREGSILRIESSVKTYLTLAEVQAFGKPVSGGGHKDHAVQLKLRNCRQSSDYNGNSRCSKAIDGNTNQKWSHKSLSCTKKEANAFWETQLERPTQFSRVRIFNRQDCCAKRLNNFVIKVDGEECARYDRSTSFSVKTFRCSKVGRVLRIEGRTRNYLTLAEVQAFGFESGTGKSSPMLRLSSCQQSSNYAGRYKCNLAIDGNTNQNWYTRSQATTNKEATPWWEARTQAPGMIDRVRIFNRQDCCPERLQHFVIKVDGNICARYDSKAPFSVWTFDCHHEGSIVRIESSVKTYLTLAEVEVFGSLSSTSGSESFDKQLKLKNCRQSSDYNGNSRCSKAIDGNTNQKWSHKSLSCTKKEANAFWETQLEHPTQFSRVRIFNRQDCCAKRLTNFVIKVDGQVCARYKSSKSFSVKSFNCDRFGRVLRIESQISTYLTLAEVQAFGWSQGQEYESPLLKMSNCAQSSNYKGGHKCNLAIDGNTDQSWSGHSQACTNAEAKPWWEARTEAPAIIDRVRIFNRQDCCPERLNNFVIKVDGKICARYNKPGPFSVWTFDCNKEGSVVRIESQKKGYLTLAEVQVLGVTVTTEVFEHNVYQNET